MPLYVMIGKDGTQGHARREQHRLSHRAHLRKLEQDGTIVYAGPIRDDLDENSIGAVIILQADSLFEARRIVNNDPYVEGGVFETIQVSPFRQAIPKSE